MNQFIQEAKYLIYKHGVSITYKVITEGAYDVNTGGVTNTETSTTLKAFPKKIKATQYNYPALIEKDVIEFLIIATDLAGILGNQDKIVFGTDTYSVHTFSEHYALSEKVIYKVIAVKG